MEYVRRNILTNAIPSHRFSGKTPVEEIVATMKEFVESVAISSASKKE